MHTGLVCILQTNPGFQSNRNPVVPWYGEHQKSVTVEKISDENSDIVSFEGSLVPDNVFQNFSDLYGCRMKRNRKRGNVS